MKIRFAHIRAQVFDPYTGEWHTLTKGGTTFCYQFLPDGKLRISKADCSLRDNYNRKIGRAVSQGRMETGRYIEVPYTPKDGTNVVDFLLDVEWK